MRSLITTADWVATFELLELVGVGMDFVTSSFTYLLFHLVIHTSGNTLLSSIVTLFDLIQSHFDSLMTCCITLRDLGLLAITDSESENPISSFT